MPKLASEPTKAAPPEDGGDSPAKAPEAPKKTTKTAKKAAQAPVKPSLLSQGKSLADQTDFVNGLWMGNQKTGKTTDVAHMAHLGRVAYINAEGGIKKAPLQKLGVPVENIISFPPEDGDITYPYLEDLFWELKAALEDDPTSWAGVIWDSVTEIHKELLFQVRDYMNERARRKGQSRTKDAQPGDLYDAFFTDISDYGTMTDQVRLLLRRYRDLPCHFAVTALHRRDKDDDGHVLYSPLVTPKLGEDLLGYVDVIGVTDMIELMDEECYRALFRPLGKYRGGDRFGVLPRRLFDPTFDRVVKYVNGDLDQDNDPVMQQIAELAAQAGRFEAKATEQEPAAEGDDVDPEDGATES